MREVAVGTSVAMVIVSITAFWLLHAASSPDAFFGAFSLLGGPLLLVCFGAWLLARAAGAYSGAVVGFAMACLAESYYEQRLYPGQNSMPGFGIVFLCLPAAALSLLVLAAVLRGFKLRKPVVASAVSFVLMVAPIGVLLGRSIARHGGA
jgi:hypothetical protein